MGQSANDWSEVTTVQTAFDIIELLQERNGADLTTLARELDLAKSTVHRLLGTLRNRGYVVREDGRFHVGLQFAKLGEHARSRKPAYPLARRKVKELADETGERVQFMVAERDAAVYVFIEHGERAVKTSPGIGGSVPLYAAASGKAMLAHFPEETVERLIDDTGLEPLTKYTITDPDRLWAELEAIRERGYAYNNQEAIEGLRVVGVPVMGPNGSVIGALSVSGPTHRVTDAVADELAELLLGATNELELNILYS